MRAADIKANVQALSQACAQQMQADSELDPIRTKVQLIRTLTEGAPPPEILSNNSKPTSEERLAIARWAALADECAQQQMRYLLTLSLPPNSISGRDKLVLLLREANEQRGVLIAALYDGRLTYSEFAAERMKVGDQFVAALSGTASPRQATEQVVATPLNISPSPVGSSESQLREGNEVALERRGNSYLVPVAVNGLPPMGFILDTGADDVSLPAEVVFTLLRTSTLQYTDFIGNSIYRLADGRELPSLNFKIRELQVGRHLIRNVVGSLNSFGADPLLGGSFLSHFAQWKIDNRRHVLVLSP
jgi:predicted aspartyl protease